MVKVRRSAVWVVMLAVVMTAGVLMQMSPVERNVTEIVPQSTGCFSQHESGGSRTRLVVCFSIHGNVTSWISPAGHQHLGLHEEGYVLCAGGDNFNYFDAGSAESGFGGPTVTQPGGANTLPLTIERTTTDGRFRLRQTYDVDPAEHDVTITMTVTNLSGDTQNVVLGRYFNANISNATDNYWARTSDSVWG